MHSPGGESCRSFPAGFGARVQKTGSRSRRPRPASARALLGSAFLNACSCLHVSAYVYGGARGAAPLIQWLVCLLSGWLVSARCRRAWPRRSGRHLGGLALSAPLRVRGVAPMLRAMQASLDQLVEHAPRKRMVAGSVPAGGIRPTDGQRFRGRARGRVRRIRPACLAKLA